MLLILLKAMYDVVNIIFLDVALVCHGLRAAWTTYEGLSLSAIE